MKRSVLALATALLVALVWFLWPNHDEVGAVALNRPGLPASFAAQSKIEIQKSKFPSSPAPGEISHLADALNSPATDIRADLRIVEECIATYRSNFPRDGNPIGTNAEITAALTGRNQLHLALIPPNHPAISRDGELCDRWGTPFFFHAESGTRMIVHSAGPDKKLHTPDDEVFSP